MRPPNTGGLFRLPLFIGALGAPIVYVMYGLAHAGARSLESPVVIAAAFGSAYLFSLVLTAFGLAIAVALMKTAVFRRRAFLLGVACVLSFAFFSAAVGGAFAGILALAMGSANLLLILIILAFKNQHNPPGASPS